MLFNVAPSTTEPVRMLTVSVVCPMPTSATLTGIVAAEEGVAVAVGVVVAVAVVFGVAVAVAFDVGVVVPFTVVVAVGAAVGVTAGVGVAAGVVSRLVLVVLGSLLNRLVMSLAVGDTPFWKPVTVATVA
jgi:hypothetical protein